MVSFYNHSGAPCHEPRAITLQALHILFTILATGLSAITLHLPCLLFFHLNKIGYLKTLLLLQKLRSKGWDEKLINAEEYEGKGIRTKETVGPFRYGNSVNSDCSLGFIIIIIIIIIILLTTLLQGVYKYIHETNYVLGHVVLQLFCIYSLCYTLFYFACEVCFVLVHYHFP
jgi:hypothetical protein